MKKSVIYLLSFLGSLVFVVGLLAAPSPKNYTEVYMATGPMLLHWPPAALANWDW